MMALTPRGVRRAVLIAAAVYVAVVEGTIPAAERNYWTHNYLAKFSQDQQRHLTNLIRRKAFEEIDRLLKIGDNFLLRDIIGVTAGFQSADASSMLSPFVRPETLVIALVVFPVGVHITEQIGCTGIRDDLPDVGVLSCRVTVRFIGTIAVVWPR